MCQITFQKNAIKGYKAVLLTNYVGRTVLFFCFTCITGSYESFDDSNSSNNSSTPWNKLGK